MKREQESTRRRGVAAWYLVICMGALCLFMSLGVDMARVQVAKTELMRAADAGSRAAAAKVPGDLTTAQNLAIQFAGQNSADGTTVNIGTSDIVFGSWNASTKIFTPLSDATALLSANAVQVTTSRGTATGNSIPLMFASLYGQRTCDLHATVIASPLIVESSFGIIGLDWVRLRGGSATVDSYKSSNGPYDPLTARQNGDVSSNGTIVLDSGTTIKGDAYAGAGYAPTGGTVTGLRTSLTYPVVLNPVPVGTAATSNKDSTIASNMTGLDFNVSSKTTVNFTAGVYYVHNFSASGQSILNANIDGPVIVYVTGNLDLSGQTLTYNNKPQNFQFVMTTPGTTANLSGKAGLAVNLYAPFSNVVISGNGSSYGQVVGKTIDISGNGLIHFDEDATTSYDGRRIVTVK